MLALPALFAGADGRPVSDHIRRDGLVLQRSSEMRGLLALQAFSFALIAARTVTHPAQWQGPATRARDALARDDGRAAGDPLRHDGRAPKCALQAWSRMVLRVPALWASSSGTMSWHSHARTRSRTDGSAVGEHKWHDGKAPPHSQEMCKAWRRTTGATRCPTPNAFKRTPAAMLKNHPPPEACRHPHSIQSS